MSGEPHVRIDRGRLEQRGVQGEAEHAPVRKRDRTEPARPTDALQASRLPYHTGRTAAPARRQEAKPAAALPTTIRPRCQQKSARKSRLVTKVPMQAGAGHPLSVARQWSATQPGALAVSLGRPGGPSGKAMARKGGRAADV